ncbi:hypothetical protein TeGR_g13871, partial [Tetraparma gracilis]
APTRSIAAAARTATSGAEIESPLSRALELRGGAGGPLACITKDRTVTAYAAVWTLYGLQMLLIPQKVHSDHFASPGSEMINFWIRGQSACVGGFVYLLMKMTDRELAYKTAFFSTLATAVLYPYNAKFGFFSKEYKVKYPMHYVPEVLFAGLIVAALIAK